DTWWALPVTVVVVLGSFIVYSTWAALQNAHYYAPPYLSPFYSPCISKSCLHSTFGWGLPDMTFPVIGIVSPAFLILWGPGLFRLTCYYYRKAYYRSFWLAPPACAVRDVKAGYSGETRFPLFLQNYHRYALYVAVVFQPATQRAGPGVRRALAVQRRAHGSLHPSRLDGHHQRREDLLMARQAYETHEHDVIVIGAGGAGLRAAIEAAAQGVSVGLV